MMYIRMGNSSKGRLGSFEYHKPNPSLGGYFGLNGIFSTLLKKTGKQTVRAGAQVEAVENRFTAITDAIRGKSSHVPIPTGPAPEQLEAQQAKENALEADRIALLEKQADLTKNLEDSRRESVAAQEQARAELATLQQQMQIQQAEQQAFQQQLLKQLEEEKSKSSLIPIALGVVGLVTLVLVLTLKK